MDKKLGNCLLMNVTKKTAPRNANGGGKTLIKAILMKGLGKKWDHLSPASSAARFIEDSLDCESHNGPGNNRLWRCRVQQWAMCNVYMFIIPTSSPRPALPCWPCYTCFLSLTIIVRNSLGSVLRAVVRHGNSYSFFNFSSSAWSRCRPLASWDGELRIYLPVLFPFLWIMDSRDQDRSGGGGRKIWEMWDGD